MNNKNLIKAPVQEQSPALTEYYAERLAHESGAHWRNLSQTERNKWRDIARSKQVAPAAPVQEPLGSFQHRCVECKGVFSASRAPRSGRCLRCTAQPATEESSADLINSMRETMRHQSQVITDLRQQIEILNEKISQKENEMNENTQQTQSTTPTHGWGVVTETADGGFNGRPETQDNEFEVAYRKLLADDTDAVRWATEFANKFTVWSNDGVEPDTKGLMIAWFANAIMAGVDNARRHEKSKYVELHQWRRIDIPKQTGWFDDTIERAYYSDPARLEGRTVYVKR